MKQISALLPSRKITAFVLMPALTLFIAWFVVNYETNNSAAKQESKKTLATTLEEGRASVQTLDSDGDGLKDWEETLYGSDPDDVDTDKDGINDGAEVRDGRDPLIPGDVAQSDIDVEEQVFVFYKDDPNLSRTDVLARDFFKTYSQLKNSDTLGTDLTERAIDDAINSNIILEEVRPYSRTNISVVADSATNKNVYKNNFTVAANTLRQIQFNELELLARFLEINDIEAYAEIQKNVEIYKNFINLMAETSVPAQASELHIELLNNYSTFVFTIEQMMNTQDDPLTALLYAEKFISDERNVVISAGVLSLYFNND